MNTDTRTAVELAQLRAEMHASNKNMERIAKSIEDSNRDIQERLRSVETELAHLRGVIRLFQWLGAPAAAGVVIYLAKFH